MRTATWSELDPDATYYGWHDPRDGYVVSCNETLSQARSLAAGYQSITVAFIAGEHVRVPDGDPPCEPSLAELRRASDEAELAWHQGRAELMAFYEARVRLLRARLAEGEK